jgi:hypothetical protein
MAVSFSEQAGSVLVRELLEALGVGQRQECTVPPPGKPSDYVGVDAALQWLDQVAEAGGAYGVRARFLRVRLILNSAG